MTDSKRNISEVAAASAFSQSHEDKKAHTKAGRKPIDTEPKLKRTAQNRAAQRAYRERKEQKMRELEEKVKSLEDINVQMSTESDFLQAQVDVLKKELARYRGHLDFSDLNLPTKVGHLLNPKSKTAAVDFDNSNYNNPARTNSLGNTLSTSLNGTTNGQSKSPTQNSHAAKKHGVANYSPPSLKGDWNRYPGSASSGENAVDNSLSSTFALPLNNNLLVSPDSSVGSLSIPIKNEHLDLTSPTGGQFDELVDAFCALLNQACGTKACPVPKDLNKGYTPSYSGSDIRSDVRNMRGKTNNDFKGNSDFGGEYGNDGTNEFGTNDFGTNFGPNDFGANNFTANDGSNLDYNANPSAFAQNADLLFLLDSNLDMDLAFGNNVLPEGAYAEQQDPLAFLTTEESVYDPLGDGMYGKPQSNSGRYEIKQEDTGFGGLEKTGGELGSKVGEKESDDEVVPAPEKHIKCSEIWDRITSHPRYTDIDIDGLCLELKAKAKCLEKGVVIDLVDVNLLLEQSAMKRK